VGLLRGELYDAYVKDENRRVIERELERPGLRERIARMDAAQFYAFLRDEYFPWKFTSEPELKGNLKWLAGHVTTQLWTGLNGRGATSSIEAKSARAHRSGC
jgi:hypothetical protein